MTKQKWVELLTEWDKRILSILREDRKKNKYEGYTDILRLLKKGTLGYPPAKEQEITKAETRLGLSLPESYKNFLRVSNGWDQLGIGSDCQVGLVYPIEEVDYFKSKDPYLFSAVEDMPWDSAEVSDFGLIPGDGHVVTEFVKNNYSSEKFSKIIAISEVGVEQYLLYPEAVHTGEELEAWRWSTSAEIYRYWSFWDLMQSEYTRLLS
jgi:hypothetical protein